MSGATARRTCYTVRMNLRTHAIGKKAVLVAALGLTALVAAFYAFNAYLYAQKQGDGNSYEPYRGTLVGEYVCLPHRNAEGPQTDECALGLKTDVGEYFAIDFGLMSQAQPALSVGDRISASGVITPVERLSSEYWRNYPIEAIFSVTDSLQVIK